jgi:hypothetical protein
MIEFGLAVATDATYAAVRSALPQLAITRIWIISILRSGSGLAIFA